MSKRRPSPDTVIVDLTASDDEEIRTDQEARLGDVRRNLTANNASNKKLKKEGQRAAVKKEGERSFVHYPDVEVLEEASKPLVVPTPTATLEEDKKDDDVVMVGTVNETRLPHMRQHCTKFRLETSRFHTDYDKNEKHCDLCYCYVCDCPAKDCMTWMSHCNATDGDYVWVQRRHAKQQETGMSTSGTATFTISSAARRRMDLRMDPRHITAAEVGPFELNHTQAIADSAFSQCRKCGWHSRLGNYFCGGRYTASTKYCRKCGRVATQEDCTNQVQSHPYTPKPTDYCLGTKEIPFTLVPRDIRAVEKYKDSWASEHWVYDESEMAEESFQHKLGQRPTILSILEMLSEYPKELKKSEADAIFLSDNKDLPLLRVLQKVSSFGKTLCAVNPLISKADGIAGDISATYCKQSCSGVITIRVFLPCVSRRDEIYSELLGSWFDVFPFTLMDLCGLVKATYSKHVFENEPSRKLMETAVADHNQAQAIFRSQLTLSSSTEKDYLGGITNNDTSIKGMLQRYYRETLGEQSLSYNGCNWEDLEQGAEISATSSYKDASMSQLLFDFKDCMLYESCLFRTAKKVSSRVEKPNGIMDHLENLSHEAEVHCEGLNVELLAFQKQSLKWAIERERTPGGIQSYFWAKVPVRVGASNKKSNTKHLYYNPILHRFRDTKPAVVRGGFIAEEMGLGKTVVSLALILKNPAPKFPVSGCPISSLSLKDAPNTHSSEDGIFQSTWDRLLYGKTSSVFPKRGSILTRGTLVICPVSLVGQWIEEAKSKLDNPGLVYPYHGQNRTRDASVLAKNAIVVTTYQVLASDYTYHRSKSKDQDYCPPLEQIRWWRVICDEGHSLRQANTKRNQSIANLVADHKWLVSGTPINTNISDLKNQLKFLGIEHVDDFFRVFNPPKSRGRRFYLSGQTESKGAMLFFLRSIMMRHTQNQKYRGTETTLMSLPSKSERIVEVNISDTEEKEYTALDDKARKFYVTFKAAHRHDLSSYYLKLSQKLTPMRIACSGGFVPQEETANNDQGDGKDDVGEDENKPSKKSRHKKQIKYGDFAFTSKFKALLTELERIRDEDPTSKSLVFSQYTSTLKWLQEELPKHGFQFRTLSGDMTMQQRAKALHDFQADPPTTIFLLSMRSGNCGINLTQANRVFLMEPGFNPALEQQAIGRVHRLGQKREVEIVRLLIKNSVETRIGEFLNRKYGKSSKKENGTDEGMKQGVAVVGPVGNVTTEKPKSKILAAEFDILFGVKDEDLPQPPDKSEDDENETMPNEAVSSVLI